MRIAACLHVTTETANLMETLAAGGAEVALCASNPLSTQDDVAAALVEQSGIDVYAIKGEDTDMFFKHINACLDIRPHITMDDGADMVSVLHKQRVDQITEIMGGTEETTTGVIRLRAMASDGALEYPIVQRERRGHQAPVRQPVRHRPVDDRRDHAGDQPAPRRPDVRRLRLRDVRAWRGIPRSRAWART